MTVEISSAVLAAIRAEAAAKPDREICGLIFGDVERVDAHRSCNNVAENPADSFEIDPAALIGAYRAERGAGPKIAGCYHSHPSGTAAPSPRDAAAAQADDRLWLIVAPGAVGLYRAVERGAIHGRFETVDYRVASDG